MRTTTILAFSALSAVALAQAPLYGQCGGSGWTGAKTCVSGACCQVSNEWYSQCLPCSNGGGSSARTSTTTRATTATTRAATSTLRTSTTTRAATTVVVPPPAGATTVFPKPAGSTALPTARVISGHFDGGMLRWERNPNTCAGQKETGESEAMFILEDGASISNAILGAAQAEGIHCRGTCTITNVWWEDVCEDAATFKQTSGTSYINGGGAQHADDKIFQFNGKGTVSISNFFANDYGKVIRSCGDCDNNGGPRNVIINNVIAKDGGVLCGINTNYGDTCKITNSCQNGNKSCDRYQGVSNHNGESQKLGSGPDGTYCTTTGFTSSC